MPSSTYISTAELKATLTIGSSYADADIVVAIDAASRACDGYKDTRFWATTESRYYTGCPGEGALHIDALANAATVLFDIDGDGTHETTLTYGTDYYLDPINASNESAPYRRIVLYRQAGKTFPSYDNAVKVTGSFGWPAVPAAVKQATSILAGRLLKRARETPYGIVVVSGDAVAAARLGRIDPDVAFLLDNLPGDAPVLVM